MPPGWSLRPTNAEMREKERKAIQGMVEIGSGPSFVAPRRLSGAPCPPQSPHQNNSIEGQSRPRSAVRAQTGAQGDGDRSLVLPIERQIPIPYTAQKKSSHPPHYHPGRECPFEFRQDLKRKNAAEISTYGSLHGNRPPSRTSRTPSPVSTRDGRKRSTTGTEYAFGSITKPKPGSLPFGWRMFFTPERRECFIHIDSDRAFWAIPSSLAPYPLCKIQQAGPSGRPLPKDWRAIRLPDGILVYLQRYAAQAEYDIGVDPHPGAHDETVSSIPHESVMQDTNDNSSTNSEVEHAVIYTPLPKRKGAPSAATTTTKQPVTARESRNASPSPRASLSPHVRKSREMSSGASNYSRRTPSPSRRSSPTSTRASGSRFNPPPPTLPDNTFFKYQDQRIIGAKSTKKHFEAKPTYGIGKGPELQLGTRENVAMATTRSKSTEYRERFNPPSPVQHDTIERAKAAGVKTTGGGHAQEWRAIARDIQRAIGSHGD